MTPMLLAVLHTYPVTMGTYGYRMRVELTNQGSHVALYRHEGRASVFRWRTLASYLRIQNAFDEVGWNTSPSKRAAAEPQPWLFSLPQWSAT